MRHIHRSNKKDIDEQLTKTKTSSYNNLSKKELEVLEQLKRRDDIIKTSADKGGAIVIQDAKLYIKEAERQLNNTENYRSQPNDPTKINNDTVNKTIKRFQKEHLIKDKIAEALITQNPRAPRFYTKPKIHKKKESLED